MSKENKVSNIAIIGLGTVGTGVAKIIQQNAELIKHRTGIELNLTHVVDKNPDRQNQVDLPSGTFHDDINKVYNDSSVDIAVELIGGTTIAAEITKKLLSSGKHVVTANKALLAEKGKEIYQTARENQKCIAFEASCCGGIPLICSLRTGLAANNITAMYGIANGTCNYILSSMSQEGKEYAVALKEAQDAGYAEADPTLDINGGDSAHKIAILASIAFGVEVGFDDVMYQGIEEITLTDIRHAQEMGYAVKLLAIAEQTEHGISLRVHPSFIHEDEPLAQVSGSFNAMSIFGQEVGHTSYYGRGAGELPTASAVVADIIEAARGNSYELFSTAPGFGQPASPAKLCPPEKIESRYYLRLAVADQPGVLAKITEILGKRRISISACIQHEGHENESVQLVIVTHQALQGDMQDAINEFQKLDVVKDKPVCIHVVTPPVDG